jgi:uncharacterized membrane protein
MYIAEIVKKELVVISEKGKNIFSFIFIMFFGVFGLASFFAGSWSVALGFSTLVVLLIVLLMFRLHRTHSANSAFALSHIFSSQAKVISKASQVLGNPYSTGTQYYISFEFQDETRKNFNVIVTQYNTIIEGDIGVLIYRQCETTSFFVDFQRQT